MQFALIISSAIVATLAGTVTAETHTVHFTNNCAFGTPTLVQNGNILSTGSDYVSNGPLISAIAYLQTGGCGLDGEGCTLVETTLVNPTSPGTGSGTDISLIPPHTFSVPAGFGYYNGCDGVGANCTDPICPDAARNPDQLQIVCQAYNVDLAITFCNS